MKVKLKAETHTHAGQEYRRGDIIEMPEDSAEWLVKIGAAERVQDTRENKSRNRRGD